MIRHYTCVICLLPKTTDATRGPVPTKCTTCRPRQPRGPVKVKSNEISTRAESILQQERVAEAIRMRLEYHTWSDIALHLGWGTTQNTAKAAVKRELERRRAAMDETLDELRNREFDRLETLGREALAVLEKDHLMTSGGRVVFFGPDGQERPLLDDGPKLAAINTLVKVSESLRKLLGLDAATKVDAAVTVQYTVTGIAPEEMP